MMISNMFYTPHSVAQTPHLTLAKSQGIDMTTYIKEGFGHLICNI